MRSLVKLGLIAALVLAPTAALAKDKKGDKSEDSKEDEGPVNPYEVIEADPALRTHGWIAISIGAAALIAGGITGGVALYFDKDLEKKCEQDQCAPPHHNRLDQRDALATSSTALIASGFALTLAGLLVLTAFAPDKEEDVASGKGSEVVLLPLASPQLTGAALEWRF